MSNGHYATVGGSTTKEIWKAALGTFLYGFIMAFVTIFKVLFWILIFACVFCSGNGSRRR